MSKPGKTLAEQIGLGLLASNPSRIPREARGDIRAYNEERYEERIASRDWHETLLRMRDTFRALGLPAEISLTVPTPWNWEIEFESEASDLEDSDSDSDSDAESVYSGSDFEDNHLSERGFAKYLDRKGKREMREEYRAAAKAADKEYRAEAAKAAYAKRLEDRAAAVAAATTA
jgi:hypothetical protein